MAASRAHGSSRPETVPRAQVGSRIERAAVELFTERGPAEVTSAEIADRAGVTERTFYRHFRTKLDAFFGDEQRLQEHLAGLVRGAPAELSALAAALHAMRGYATMFSASRDAVLARAAVVDTHPELTSREAAHAGAWATVLHEALRVGGSGTGAARDGDADLAAGLSLTLFRLAYRRWVEADGRPALETVLDEVVARGAEQLGLMGAAPNRS